MNHADRSVAFVFSSLIHVLLTSFLVGAGIDLFVRLLIEVPVFAFFYSSIVRILNNWKATP